MTWTSSGRRAAIALALVCASCSPSGTSGSSAPPSASASASAGGSAFAPSDPAKLLDLRRAEQRRSPRGVSTDAQNDRDPEVRRRAARALARIATPTSRAGLLRALSDGDDETVAWAAYGLGAICADAREDTVSQLVARSLTLPEESAARLDPLVSVARAIGRCAATTTEATLAAWLASSRPRARAAALGFGDFVGAQQRLREDTIATLLNLSLGSPSSPPIVEAIFPIARLEKPPKSVLTRIAEVGVKLLGTPSDMRILAIRALGRSRSDAAVSALATVVPSPEGFSAEERVEAVRALGRGGPKGLAAVATAVSSAAFSAETIAGGGPAFDVLHAMLLVPFEPAEAKTALTSLASLAPADGAAAAGRRRLSAIRCAASARLAGANVTDATLLACDLEGATGSVGSRALVGVLDRGPIEGPRLTLWQTLARSKDPRTREAAIALVQSHGELTNTWEVLAAALEATESGVIESAAEVLTAFPDEGARLAPAGGAKPKKIKDDPPAPGGGRPKPKPGVAPLEPQKRIVDGLAKALERAEKTEDVELAIGVIDALGALQRKSFEAKLRTFCASTYPALREHASTALGAITGTKPACPAPDVAGPDPAEIAAPEAKVTIVLDTDAGELRLALDGELAPVTVARFVDLVKTGYYDGNLLHRVDPAFVVQWGSPWGDSSGGPAGRAPLRCETSPLPFDRLRVGVALSGRDTGSSQFFVTRSRAPHLDGQYGIIGVADGPWDRVSEGDVIKKARVE